jgi:SPP1 gp7 family putative phage head morphogenesis protein
MPDGFDLGVFERHGTRDWGKRKIYPVEVARRAEKQYASKLRTVARYIGAVVSSIDPRTAEGIASVQDALTRYAKAVEPWARAVGSRMLAEVANRDRRGWQEYTRAMSRALRQEIESAPTGQAMQGLLDQQVGLITSMPREAAQRVQRLATEARIKGQRPEALVAEIMRTGQVSEAKARTIAHTEVGRAATALTEARMLAVGSTSYIWRTVGGPASNKPGGDATVRPSHRAMNGKVVRWDNPPTLDGLTGHAGALPNCRCIPIPILPED